MTHFIRKFQINKSNCDFSKFLYSMAVLNIIFFNFFRKSEKYPYVPDFFQIKKFLNVQRNAEMYTQTQCTTNTGKFWIKAHSTTSSKKGIKLLHFEEGKCRHQYILKLIRSKCSDRIRLQQGNVTIGYKSVVIGKGKPAIEIKYIFTLITSFS